MWFDNTPSNLITAKEALSMAQTFTDKNLEKELTRVNKIIRKEAARGYTRTAIQCHTVPFLLADKVRATLTEKGFEVRYDGIVYIIIWRNL